MTAADIKATVTRVLTDKRVEIVTMPMPGTRAARPLERPPLEARGRWIWTSAHRCRRPPAREEGTDMRCLHLNAPRLLVMLLLAPAVPAAAGDDDARPRPAPSRSRR